MHKHAMNCATCMYMYMYNVMYIILTRAYYLFYLTFAVAPEISVVTPPNASFVVVEDAQQAFTVYIDINGNPAPTFQWTRNGVALTNSASVYFNQSTIRIYQLRENSSDYEVVYSNNIDPAATHTFSVDVQCKLYTCSRFSSPCVHQIIVSNKLNYSTFMYIIIYIKAGM